MRPVYLFIFACVIISLSAKAQYLTIKENKELADFGEYIYQAKFSPFRNYFAYTVGNNTLRILDRDWETIFEYQGNPRSVGGVIAFSPDEKYLAYGKYKTEKDIAIIELENRRVVQILSRHTDHVNHLEFSHDGKYLVSSGNDNQLIIWKMEEESFIMAQDIDFFEKSLNESSFSHDDRYLATGDDYGNVLILQQDKNGLFNPVQNFQNRKHEVNSIQFHPSREEFVTGSSYGIRRYKLEKNQFVFSDSVFENATVYYPVHFSPDGEFLALANYNNAVIFHMGQEEIKPQETIYRHSENIFGVSFSEDGKFLTTCGLDQRIIIWEMDGISSSDRSRVVSWMNGDLTLAQRRALNPATVGRIVRAADIDLIQPKGEFEKTVDFNKRRERLSDFTLLELQQEMENQYGIRTRGNYVEIPIQGLIGYNADLEIYKIKFMETEAGVAIPVTSAKALYNRGPEGYIRATKRKVDGKPYYVYDSFELFHTGDQGYYPVTPLENPFHREEELDISRSEPVSETIDVSEDNKDPGTTYALMFASNVYDYYPDLVNPVLDAQTIATELGESYGVVSEVVINPTLSETASKIREYATRIYQPEDNLLVFFAGHGVYDEVFREGYVISRDSQMDDPGKTSYLSHSNLRTMINNIGCPHIFLVMDVCFGGTFDPHLATMHRGAAAEYNEISTEEFVSRKLKYKTRLYLTSGGKEYVPDGRPGFHSPFARRFIESLRYYGGNDGVLTTSEILQFVEKVNPQPRFGEFGDNEPGSDFILVVR